MNTHLLKDDLSLKIRTLNNNLDHYDKMFIAHKDSNKVEAELYSIKIEIDKRNLEKLVNCLNLINTLEETFLSKNDIEAVREKFKEV